MSISSYIVDGKKFYEVRFKGRDKSGKQVCRRKAGILSITKARAVELDLRNVALKVSGEDTSKNICRVAPRIS